MDHVDKLDGLNLVTQITICVPLSDDNYNNTYMIVNIEKNSITEFPLRDRTFDMYPDVKHLSQNISISGSGICRSYDHSRRVSEDEINSVDLDMMPGFRLTWKYSKQLEPHSKYLNTTYLPWMNYNSKNKQFIR